MTSPTIRRNKK